jgi:hypothetical protein
VDLFEGYVKEARRLKEKYANQIKIIIGLETEYIIPLPASSSSSSSPHLPVGLSSSTTIITSPSPSSFSSSSSVSEIIASSTPFSTLSLLASSSSSSFSCASSSSPLSPSLPLSLTSPSIFQVLSLVSLHSLDYFVGSVHHVLGIPIDMGEGLFSQAEELLGGTEGLFLQYFEDQHQLLSNLKPKVIGHFDVVRLYRPNFVLTPKILEKVDRNIALGDL